MRCSAKSWPWSPWRTRRTGSPTATVCRSTQRSTSDGGVALGPVVAEFFEVEKKTAQADIRVGTAARGFEYGQLDPVEAALCGDDFLRCAGVLRDDHCLIAAIRFDLG